MRAATTISPRCAEAQGELALAWLDISTGDFAAQPLAPRRSSPAALARLAPGELLRARPAAGAASAEGRARRTGTRC